MQPLRPYQSDGIDWLRSTGRCLLADEMGLGKSRQLIEASVGPTLIVAPAMVLAGGTWDDEIAKWADDPDRFMQVPYTGLSELEPRGQGRAPSLSLHPTIMAVPWQTVIMDEAHYIKGRTNLATRGKNKGRPPSVRAYLALKLARRVERLYLATGTPIPNYAPELFTLLQAMHPDQAQDGKRLGSYWRWAQQWFEVKPDRYSEYNIGGLLGCVGNDDCKHRPTHDPCEHYHEFVAANLNGRFLQRRRDDVLPDLPPLTRVTVKTGMGPKQKAAYNRMKKEYVAQVEDRTVVAWTSSARHVKLDRLTTGLDLIEPTEPGVEVKPTADNGKLARLAEDLADRSRPTVVMAHYRDTVEACAGVARGLGLVTAVVHGGIAKAQRAARVRAFQAGEVDVLVGSLETLAEGLTLVQADLLIFVETSYKPSRNQQAERRIHRLGQERPCVILDYCTPGTVDTNKRRLLATKTDGQMRVLTAAQFKTLL